jgi:hypothetical protein
MADKRISQLVERINIANNDVLPIVASGAITTNKVTISTIQDWMQDNLDVGVTSVGITLGTTGTNINVTGSPVTSSGNITINIPTASATNRGALSSADWSTFNSKVSSVGLSMPSAFSVANSPITGSGTIAVTGAGTVSQYIRGDGSLADFPQGGGGGGASVNYYLNGSVSQGTIGGVAYLEMNKTPILGAGTDFTINADGYIASFITDAGDPALLEIPAGNWNFETYFQASSGGGSPTFYIELYKVNSGGTATLIASNSGTPELIAFGTSTTPYFSALAVPTTTLALTDRLALRYYVTHSGRTITLHTENNTLCQIITTFTTGLTALNGLTAQVQNFATGTSGSDFNISSSTSTHTFNLPTASATNRGALSSADWTTFNNKTSNLGTVTSVGLSSATSGVFIGTTPITTSGSLSFTIATASGSQNGLLSSTDWTTFNGKQNALTNPITGTGATGQVAYWNGTNSQTGSNNLFWDNANLKFGIGTNTPEATGLTVAGGGIIVSLDSGAARRILELYSQSGIAKISASYVGASSYGSLELLTSNVPRLTIADTGAATFSSSVTALNATFKNQGSSPNNTLFVQTSDYASGSVGSVLRLGHVATTGSTTAIIQNLTAGGTGTGNISFPEGNVGIGTASPSGRLHIVSASGGNTPSNYLQIEGSIADNSNYPGISFKGGTLATTYPNISLTNGGLALNLSNGIATAYNNPAQISLNNGTISFSTGDNAAATQRMLITSDGKVIVRQSNFTYPVSIEAQSGGGQLALTRSGAYTEFYMSGSTGAGTELYIRSGGSGGVYLPAGGIAWFSASDERLKTDLIDIENGLEKVSSLRSVIGRYLTDSEDKKRSFLIAQDVEKVLPEAVVTNEETGDMGLSYTEVIPLLVAAIKELKIEIDSLKNQIK